MEISKEDVLHLLPPDRVGAADCGNLSGDKPLGDEA
jgi:hypothetical protein